MNVDVKASLQQLELQNHQTLAAADFLFFAKHEIANSKMAFWDINGAVDLLLNGYQTLLPTSIMVISFVRVDVLFEREWKKQENSWLIIQSYRRGRKDSLSGIYGFV